MFHILSNAFNWRKKTQWLTLFVCGSFLIGCSSVPQAPLHSVEWQSHQQQLTDLLYYTLSGKMAYIGADDRQSLNFYWKRTPANTQLTLTTFLGQTALDLTFTNMGAKVVTYDGRTFTHPNANMLVKKLTGLSIPVKELSDWVKGMPTNADHYTVSNLNTLATLEKNVTGQDWAIQFDRYRDQISENNVNYVLPSSINMTHDDTRIKLSISKWLINQ